MEWLLGSDFNEIDDNLTMTLNSSWLWKKMAMLGLELTTSGLNLTGFQLGLQAMCLHNDRITILKWLYL